ncbi:class I SAM-dependent methyltransferase [Devriesea agamarum]|uniref:class I SAM-dependent methyltransferase n=1 Tax=Devriesea agamarum TaxID=472569 RepID=UPI000ABD96B7|nr:class I SAM-dependent methyltransferase [Devriesea agamarum]
MSATRPESHWERMTRQNPAHSTWYIQRFRDMRERGDDLDGEARCADAMVPRGSRILDAGCGPGRVSIALADRGHTVTGIDIDPVLIQEAQRDAASRCLGQPEFIVGDICTMSPQTVPGYPFDLIVCAGNVMTFLAEGTQRDALAAMCAVLAPDGRAVVGFGTGRGYPADAFFVDIEDAGLRVENCFSTWDLRPWHDGGNFIVAVLGKAS